MYLNTEEDCTLYHVTDLLSLPSGLQSYATDLAWDLEGILMTIARCGKEEDVAYIEKQQEFLHKKYSPWLNEFRMFSNYGSPCMAYRTSIGQIQRCFP